jgi:predicted DNA-binding transcriptional regulator AlpA
MLATNDDDKVMTLAEFLGRATISRSTWKRLNDAGDGPTITRLSARRLGVRLRDYRAWLNRRSSDQQSEGRNPVHSTEAQ